jgi:alanine racemase
LDNPLTWADIDLDAYAHNIRELRRITRSQARLMAVVKANGYGHGAVEVARTALSNGAEYLGVARLNEAVPLRQAGLEAPILVFGYSSPELAPLLIKYDLTQTVYSLSTAKFLSELATRQGKKIQVHLKVDSGMGRLGLLIPSTNGNPTKQAIQNTVRTIESIVRLPGLTVEGIFTHFATADSADKSYANLQLNRFMELLDHLKQVQLEPPLRHTANSAALIDMPESHLDMVRPGIATYGLQPSEDVNQKIIDLKPVMSLKTRIIHIKKVAPGFNISYGITYRTKDHTTIATVPVGYADGYSRLLSSRGQMLVHGRKAPIVGRVCMDLTMLDVGGIADVSLEDEVVVFGRQGEACLTADDIASDLETINYEIVSTIAGRVPRIYQKS